MSKGWRRTWIKIFVTGWLHGSIRWQLEADERGVWADLIALAGECGQEGAIIDNDKKPYPRSFIASQFNIPQELLDRTIAKCRADGRLDDRDDQIIITNWKAYQSEYERQKPYRKKEEQDPDKYIKGKYGHLVTRTKEDLKRIKGEQEK